MSAYQEPTPDVRAMYVAHRMFRREFSSMPILVNSVARGDTERSQLVAAHIELVVFAFYQHHRIEDAHLTPKLLARGSEELACVVCLMENHHARFEHIGAEIDRALRDWRNSASESGDLLANAIGRILPLLNEHMDLEEERILPAVEKYITQTEWDAMFRDAMSSVPAEVIPLILGMMIYEADSGSVEAALAPLPRETRSAIEKLSRRAFEIHAGRVYGKHKKSLA